MQPVETVRGCEHAQEEVCIGELRNGGDRGHLAPRAAGHESGGEGADGGATTHRGAARLLLVTAILVMPVDGSCAATFRAAVGRGRPHARGVSRWLTC
jgi:hypothetical protein